MQASSSLYSALVTLILFCMRSSFCGRSSAPWSHARARFYAGCISLLSLGEALPNCSLGHVLGPCWRTGLKPRPESSRTRVGSFSITSISWSIRMSLQPSSRLQGDHLRSESCLVRPANLDRSTSLAPASPRSSVLHLFCHNPSDTGTITIIGI